MSLSTDIAIGDLLLQLDALVAQQEPIASSIQERRAEFAQQLAPDLDRLDDLTARVNGLRETIKQTLLAAGGLPYRDQHHSVSLVTTTRPAIQDPERVRRWLDGRGTLDRYLVLDEKAVLRDLGTNVVDGIEQVASVTLRVTR